LLTTTSRPLKHGVQAGAFIAIGCGVSGVAGWIFGIRQLLSIAEAAPALMPMSALALVVAGASLWSWESHPRVARAFGGALIGLVIAATFGYAFQTDFGLGGVPADITRGAATLPGLPAPNSILALGLLGVALVTMSWSYEATHAAALLGMVVVYTAGVGELFGASRLEGLSAYTAMSPQTIVSVCALGVGILCATARGGVMPLLMDERAAGLALRRFLPVAVLLPVGFGALRVAGEAAGIFDTRFGTALMAVASGALAGLLTLDIALAIRRLDQRLAREHSARTVAESESRITHEILSLISRELRTPANDIHAQAQMLQTGLLEQTRAGEAIETIIRDAARLRRYIDDAVEVASMASGGVLIDAVELDPRDAIRAALETLSVDIRAKKIVVRDELMPVGYIAGDPRRLQQIARNLLSNAVTFTPAGGEICASTRRDGDVVEIEISDSGSGLSADLVPDPFAPFRGAQDQPGGLGLGLAIVRHLVELHGGTVSARNDPHGGGARFTVRLPATPAEEGVPKRISAN
jgi:signal transduction histidine kinase